VLLLHAGYYDGKIYFWGESPFEAEEDTSVAAKKKVHSLPFGADGETVKEAIAETLYDGSIRKVESEEIVIWIPTAGNKPLSSSPMIMEAVYQSTHLKLSPWKVEAVHIGLENTISFLSACLNKDILKSGLVLGADLNYWTLAVRFAGALVARQEYLPDLINIKGDYRGLWEPIFLGDDAKYLELMSSSMPSACRSVSTDLKGSKLAVTSPGAILTTFIVEVVDYVARHAIYSQPQSTSIFAGMASKNGEYNSIHDHWLTSLVTDENRVEGTAKELKSLQEQIQLWRKPISVTGSPFRLTLALEAPAESNGSKRGAAKDKWFVHFYLQSTKNPDVIIPAAHVWKPTEEELEVLNKARFDAKEFLLSALGKASTICPRIEAALRTDSPEGYVLDTNSAYEFLNERAVALDQAGFGVKTPEWWTPRGTKKRLGAKALITTEQDRTEGFSMNQMLNYRWEITLDGDEVSQAELKELARSKMPLIQMRGHWIHLKKDDIENALMLKKKKEDETGSLKDVVQMALGSAAIPGNFEFEGVETEGWITNFINQLEGSETFDELEPPPGFIGELRAYQKRGFSWLHFLKQWGLGACLADDMGLGKTVQALTMIQHDWEAGNRYPILIICPTSLTGNWYHETKRFTPDLPIMVHHGNKRPKGQAFKEEAEKQAIVISSYSILHRDVEIFKQVPWAGIILDEAQNIKNPKTKQSRSARSLKAGYRIAMTGTPIENNVGDLWAIMEFLNAGLLGTQNDFKRNFLLPIQANHESRSVDRLKKLTQPFILRRLKSDKTIIRDLPKKMEMKTFTTLTKEQAGLYEALVKEVEVALDTTDGMQRRGLVLSTLTKLKQICNHPTQFLQDGSELPGRSGKLSRLTEMLEEVISVDERALVFTQFAEMGKLIQAHLQETFGQEVIFLYGGVPKKKRDQMIERFQNDTHGPHIFVLSLKAGGTGLNLMRANHVFHFDRWWNPAVEDQATDRVYRIGQTRNVQIHKFLCAGTLEERIDEMLTQKKDIADRIVGAGENWLTELSTNELKKLFELRSEATAS